LVILGHYIGNTVYYTGKFTKFKEFLMKKITIISLALIAALTLFFTLSCQEPEEKEVNKEVTVTNFPPDKPDITFPAPASVEFNYVDPSDSTKCRITWTIVPNTDSYIIYFKDNFDFIYHNELVTSFKYSSNYTTDKKIYTSFTASTIAQYFNNTYNNDTIVGVRAISVDGIKSPIKWHR